MTTAAPTRTEAVPVVGARPGGTARRRAVVVGGVDGLLTAALPVVVLAAVAFLGWVGLGAPGDLAAVLRTAASAWWIGHGVDVRFVAPGGAFRVTAAALGPAIATAACAVRSGRRAARTAAPAAAWAASVAGTAVVAVVLLVAAGSAGARPSAWQSVLLPVLVVAVPSLLALRGARTGRRLPDGVRGGVAAVVLLLAAAAVLLGALLLVRGGAAVGLSESLAPGAVGGLVLTLLQVLALPTLVVWAGGWVVGAPVALGSGSATGAFGGAVGPLPALPVLAAVPADPPPAAAAVLLVPVLAGFAAAALVRRGGATGNAVVLGCTTGGVAGVLLGLLVAASAGAAGPGRFAEVGPSALLVTVLAVPLTALPAVLGAAVVRPPRVPEPEADPGRALAAGR